MACLIERHADHAATPPRRFVDLTCDPPPGGWKLDDYKCSHNLADSPNPLSRDTSAWGHISALGAYFRMGACFRMGAYFRMGPSAFRRRWFRPFSEKLCPLRF
jgi:hypothetical protein